MTGYSATAALPSAATTGSQASSQVEQLATSQPAEWNRLVAQLNQSRGRSTARDLVNAHLRTVTNPTDAVPLRLAQLRLAPDQADLSALHEVLLSGPLDQFLPVREQLRPQAVAVVPPLWTALRDESLDGPRRLRAAMALAGLAAAAMEAGVTDQSPTAPTWTPADVAFVTEQLVASNVETQALLRDALRPIHTLLAADLEQIFTAEKQPLLPRISAATAVTDFFRDIPPDWPACSPWQLPSSSPSFTNGCPLSCPSPLSTTWQPAPPHTLPMICQRLPGWPSGNSGPMRRSR